MKTQHLSNEQIFNISYYQTLEAIGGAWTEILQENLNLSPGAKILDAGCGSGFLSILLAEMGYQVLALDHSSQILQKAREQAEKHGVQDQIEFLQRDAADSGLESGSFEAVVSRNASSLFLKPLDVYGEWKRLLKEGGQLLNFDANWLSPLWDDRHAEEFLQDEQIVRETMPDYTDIYHDRFFLMKLSQYPLSYRKRPEWDQKVCELLGFRNITVRSYPAEGVLPPVLARRFRTIPMFLLKGEK